LETLNPEEYQQLLESRKRSSKYRSKKTEYNGVTYDSKKEAERAAQLDMCINAGFIKEWERQVRMPLHAPNGDRIGYYVLDFKVTDKDGNVWYEDVKGYHGIALWRWKFKHFQLEYPDLPIKII
jgi:hypothetical protein